MSDDSRSDNGEVAHLQSSHSQVRDVYVKMSETNEVGRHKVAQTLEVMQAIKKDIERSQKRLHELQNTLGKREHDKIKDINIFQNCLADLAGKMIAAKSFYTSEHISVQLRNMKTPDVYEDELLQLQRKNGEIIVDLNKTEEEVKNQCNNLEDISSQEKVELKNTAETSAKVFQDMDMDTRELHKIIQDLDATTGDMNSCDMDCV